MGLGLLNKCSVACYYSSLLWSLRGSLPSCKCWFTCPVVTSSLHLPAVRIGIGSLRHFPALSRRHRHFCTSCLHCLAHTGRMLFMSKTSCFLAHFYRAGVQCVWRLVCSSGCWPALLPLCPAFDITISRNILDSLEVLLCSAGRFLHTPRLQHMRAVQASRMIQPIPPMVQVSRRNVAA